MSLPLVHHIGLDVAKRSLDLDLLGCPLRLTHDGEGCKTLVARLRALSKPVHVICEATGGYERPVVGALHAAGITVSVVNPRQVRDYARGIGKMAKTDKIDAKVLSSFGASIEDLHPTLAPEAEQAELAAWVTRREQLQLMLNVEVCRQIPGMPKPVAANLKASITRLQAEIKKVAQKMAKLIEKMPKWQPLPRGCKPSKESAPALLPPCSGTSRSWERSKTTPSLRSLESRL